MPEFIIDVVQQLAVSAGQERWVTVKVTADTAAAAKSRVLQLLKEDDELDAFLETQDDDWEYSFIDEVDGTDVIESIVKVAGHEEEYDNELLCRIYCN